MFGLRLVGLRLSFIPCMPAAQPLRRSSQRKLHIADLDTHKSYGRFVPRTIKKELGDVVPTRLQHNCTGPCPQLRLRAAPTQTNYIALATPNPCREQVLETSALKGFAQNNFEREAMNSLTTNRQRKSYASKKAKVCRKRENYVSSHGKLWNVT